MDINQIQNRFPMGLASVAMDLDKFEYLTEYRRHGIERLEVTPMVLDNRSWQAEDPTSTQALIDRCRYHEVRPDSVHAFYLPEYGHDMADSDPAVRHQAICLNRKLLQTTASLEARYMVIHLFNEQVRRDEPEALAIAREALTELLPTAEETGVRLAIENLKTGWTVREINHLLDEFDHPLLGICLDTGHAALYTTIADEIRQCGRRLIGLHIHDNHRQQDDHLIPFRGAIDWTAFCQAIKDIDYQGPLMFESFARKDHESVPEFISACRQAYDRLLSLLAEIDPVKP
jgi:sugar phosphate isomerase/epimerase